MYIKNLLAVIVVFASYPAFCAGVSVELQGYLGDRLDRMVSEQVATKDPSYLTRPFVEKGERHGRWQTEFWGKWMHSAPAFAARTGCPMLQAKIDAGVDAIIAAQDEDGYIGNYIEKRRCAKGLGWDVWGIKYTMMGLLHYVDSEKGKVKSEQRSGVGAERRAARALDACRKLCDYVIAKIGPKGSVGCELWQTGSWCGMPSSSILEPVMGLYNRTHDQKYLDFATYIVKGMTEPAEGPRLVDLALKGIPVAERNGYGFKVKENPVPRIHNRLKAYEQMSCYQGLLEYWEVKSKSEKGKSAEFDDILRAALLTAKDIARNEVNLAGGCAGNEEWFGGAAKQHLPSMRLQETCVTITWMRLCEKLLSLTGDARWADELEKTFYNAYLAALKSDGSCFAAFTPLNGNRCYGLEQCHMHENCCNANGPRGFLSFLNAFVTAKDETVTLNFYASAKSRVALKDGDVVLETFTHYPKEGFVRIVNATPGKRCFTLALRIPSACDGATVTIDGEKVAGEVVPGDYLRIEREWTCGDGVDLVLDLKTRVHRLANHVAFTRGPVVLVRDTRFGDGPLDEPLRPGAWMTTDAPAFELVRTADPAMAMTLAATLPVGTHSESADGCLPSVVRFCDYASGANAWRNDNVCRMWLPLEQSAATDAARPPDVLAVDFAREKGAVKALHGVNNGPHRWNKSEQWEFKEAGIPFLRTHDTMGMWGNGHYVDVPNLFPNFDADENDPKNYDFTFTDAHLVTFVNAGVEIFYRLGATIEPQYRLKAYNIDPPKDPAKWARICEHIVAHYNEGWADGHHWNIRYWEIWGEPENPPLWRGTKEQYFELYRVAANHLKKRFPDIRIGGYGSCGVYAIDDVNPTEKRKSFVAWFNDFLAYVQDSKTKAPLDFFSWHIYVHDTAARIKVHADYVRRQLDAHGFQGTESILNEWNRIGPNWNEYDAMKEMPGAACVAEAFCLMQDGPVDKSMYYTGDDTGDFGGLFGGLFYNPSGRRAPTYWPFWFWNKLYQGGKGRAVAVTGPTGKGFEAVAAKGAEGEAVFVANDTADFREVRLDLPEGAWRVRVLDKTFDPKTEKPPLARVFDPQADVLELKPQSVALVFRGVETAAAAHEQEKVKFAGQD